MCADSIYVLMAAALGPRTRRSVAEPFGKYVTAATLLPVAFRAIDSATLLGFAIDVTAGLIGGNQTPKKNLPLNWRAF
jgi:hypothetical protein